jgi:hypothetical protein
MKTASSVNYRALFYNNPIYRDPKGILTREQLYIFIIWLNGLDLFSTAFLLKIPLGTVKSRQHDVFDILRTELTLNIEIDNRALIEEARDYGILTEENHKLPKEVIEWRARTKAERQKDLSMAKKSQPQLH